MNSDIIDMVAATYSLGDISETGKILYRHNTAEYSDIDSDILQAINVLDDIDDITSFLHELDRDISELARHWSLLEDIKRALTTKLKKKTVTVAEVEYSDDEFTVIGTIDDFSEHQVIVTVILKR